ncbi:hypothetical protein [Pseudomonas veronii]
MDRQITYPGQLLTESSLLQATKDAMIGCAKLSSAVLGTNTIANGFAVTPTGPASLQVLCSPGEIYSMTAIDSAVFSSLPADTTHSIMKQGILLDGVTLSCPAPGTTGQSINYLVQATYQDSDLVPVLLPYYNSTNPALPYSGIGNNGVTQNTVRKGVAVVAVKAGASATTGSQVTPAPDSGYVGLYVVTVAYGQTTITSASISQYSSAPLLPSGILQSVQNGNTSSAIDSGVVNAYVATLSPAPVSLTEGMSIRVKITTSNTGASTLSVNGFGPTAILTASRNGMIALAGFEMLAGTYSIFTYNLASGFWMLTNPARYADLYGTSTIAFSAATATQPQHAVPLGQAQALPSSIQSIAATVAASALTLTWAAQPLVFRNATLTSGSTVSATPASALSLVVPSGATLGLASGVQGQLVLLVAYNGGSPVLCVTTMYALDLSETGLISPTTISSGATSSTTIYSASAVSANSPYRVVGYIQITEATAGTWATAPTLVQGSGGQALASLQSLGFGQTWQNVVAGRALSTVYYNTTGRPIFVSIYGNPTASSTGLALILNGLTVSGSSVSAGQTACVSSIVPPGGSYSVTPGSTISSLGWLELR